jgi:hypothetical protein
MVSTNTNQERLLFGYDHSAYMVRLSLTGFAGCGAFASHSLSSSISLRLHIELALDVPCRTLNHAVANYYRPMVARILNHNNHSLA